MPRPFHLFASNSPDLAAEREALGRAVAELPVAVAWEIRHTPRTGAGVKEALAFIDTCDLYLMVLGADLHAPMGLEWQRAQAALRPTRAFASGGLHSPSAQAMLRRREIGWTWFETPREVEGHVMRLLARLLLDQGETFGLHVNDVGSLLALAEAEETGERPDERQGAERGGVIIGRGR